jgi:hypothetical protein
MGANLTAPSSRAKYQQWEIAMLKSNQFRLFTCLAICAADGTTVWQELIASQFTDFNAQLATEGAAKNNIAQGLAKISCQR